MNYIDSSSAKIVRIQAIEYRRPAYLDDTIVATVVLERMTGVRAFYRTMIERGTETLAVVDSCWCCLDAASRRPTKLAEDVARRFFLEPAR